MKRGFKPSVKLLLKGAAVIAVLYLLTIIVLMLFQNSLIFLSEKLDSSWVSPNSIREIYFTTSDQIKHMLA
ncbi:MAG: hypothetical protein HY606_06440 [Planctomycetes bacterium]|nr:hypothetical protein [Planctomycetota bacterium]